jgi:hypothetical protein
VTKLSVRARCATPQPLPPPRSGRPPRLTPLRRPPPCRTAVCLEEIAEILAADKKPVSKFWQVAWRGPAPPPHANNNKSRTHLSPPAAC